MDIPQPFSKPEQEGASRKFAVLIDADNAQASVIEGLLAEVARYGEATVRRIYGDFTSNNSAQWKKTLNQHAIKPMQQFAYTSGKNATDSTMIIDAMDLLYTRRFDGFCLVSSDSDFTGLALRLREQGLFVIGFGEEKTPEAFRNACHKFIFTEVLRPVSAPVQEQGNNDAQAAIKPSDPARPTIDDTVRAPAKRPLPIQFVLQALEQATDDSGWANLAAFGSYLNKLQPDFDPRLYGFKKLSELVRSKPHVFQVEERQLPGSNGRVTYVRKAPSKHAG